MIAMRIVKQDDGTYKLDAAAEGSTSELIEQMAMGVAGVIMEMGDDYEGEDDIHEQLCGAVLTEIGRCVHAQLRERNAADEPEEAYDAGT